MIAIDVRRIPLFFLLLTALWSAQSVIAACPLPKPKSATDWRQPAQSEHDRWRKQLAGKKNAKTDQANQAREGLANLAVTLWVRSNRLEAEGDAASARAIRSFVSDKLGDTEWRIGFQAQNQDQGAAEAVLTRVRIDPKSKPEQICQAAARAATLGSAEGLYRSALCETDATASRGKLEQAASSGHAAAQEALARICLNEGEAGTACATRWLCRAAQAGRRDSASLLGWWLGRSNADASDRVDAQAWLKFAADAGDRVAMNNFGEWWERSGDLNQALNWYRRSATAGQPEGMVNLGRMLARSDASCKEAAQWFDKANAAGLSLALEYKSKLNCK